MHIFCITNNKGGVAKTTSTVNISYALADLGYKVLVIDTDPQCNTTYSLLGSLEHAKTLYDVLIDISERYFALYGLDYFVRRVIQRIDGQGWPVAGVTGIRTPTDIRVLKEHYGDRFLLIHMQVTDDKVRYERMRSRAAERDPQSFEDFLRQDADERAIFHLDEAIHMSDVTIRNDGTLALTFTAIDELAARLGLDAKVD